MAESSSAEASDSSNNPASASSTGSPMGTLLAVLVAVGLLGGAWWFNRTEPFNVLVISLDTTRPDHLGAYGAERAPTPNLDRLAREGTVFENARTTAPWTLPSHMSLFTGLPPELHGVRYDWHRLPPDRRVMGQMFRDAGFRTVGLFTAPYVHQNFGFGRGMDFYEAATEGAMLYDRLSPGMGAEAQQQLVIETEAQSHAEVTGARLASRLNFFTHHNPADRNLFFLHFFDPHYDYLPPPSHRAAFVDPNYAGPISGRQVMSRTDIIHADMPAADLQQLKDLYDAELRFTDAQLGKILDQLEAADQLDNTLIVIVADHGEAFFENGRFGHRQDLSEETLRIPMIFWGPGRVTAGQRIADPVSLIDVLPTLLDLAELPEEPGIYGRSLRPLIEGSSLPDVPVTSLLDFISPNLTDAYARFESLVFRDLKYERWDQVQWSPETQTDFGGAVNQAARKEMVYDLAADDPEAENLLETRADDPAVAGMRERFLAERKRRDDFAVERRWQDAVIGDADLGNLSALGYLSTGEDDP